MSACNSHQKESRPNVILIVLDTARASSLSCYSNGLATTPAIDRIAKEGALFTTAISASPWTLPSHASIFTATLPSRHGANEKHRWLDKDLPTLAEILARQGYYCEAISSNSWISEEFGFARGFRKFVNTWQIFESKAYQRGPDGRGSSFRARLGSHLYEGAYLQKLVNILYRKVYYRRYDYGGLRTNLEIWRFLRRQGDRCPFFLFVNYMEPHLPYWPPVSYRERFLPAGVSSRSARQVNQDAWAYVVGEVEMSGHDFQTLKALYDAELLYVDSLIAQAWTWLGDAGLAEDTLLIITSDHGENIGDHSLMDHQYCLYDTLLKVPLIMRYPPVFSGDERVEHIVRTLDILPTVAEILEIKIPQDVRDLWQGVSVLDRSKLQDRDAIAEYWGPQPTLGALKDKYPATDTARLSRLDVSIQAIRSGRYKLVLYSDGRRELFDIADDPEEGANLVNDLPQVVRGLERRLKQQVDYPPKNVQGTVEQHDADPEVLERLRSLGYL
jgi:arylsulfatase A-like enzyme